MSQADRGGLSRPVRSALAVALAAYVGIAGWLVWRTAILEPYSDMFDWLARWRQYESTRDLAAYLWAPHNFHHLVWTFVVMAFDIRTFGASSYAFLAVGAACWFGVAAMLSVTAGAAADRGFRRIAAGGALVISLMGCDVLDASADINTTYLHAVVFAVAAILLAEGARADRLSRRIGALICAVAAGLGSAAGLAIWPALVVSAFRRGDRRWAGVVLAVGTAFSLAYLVGDTQSPGPAIGAVRGLPASLLLFLDYLGLPWVRGVPVAGWLLGLAVLGVSVTAVVVRGGRNAAWPERTAATLIQFSLGTAILAGVARAGLIAPDLVPIRYSVFLIPLHAGLWLLALPYVSAAWKRTPRTADAMAFSAAAFMLFHQGVMGLYAVRTADAYLRVLADFRQGRRTPDMITVIDADLDRAQAISAGLRRDGLYQRELRPDPAAMPVRWTSRP